MTTPSLLQDNFGRQITYVRISVTDRCDFRCLYCMDETMTFLPRSQVLSLEELQRVGRAFVALGVDKIRITGGEPLIRNDIELLFEGLGKLPELKQLCITTNASRLAEKASRLYDAGVNRVNISLDSLRPERFKKLTRFGQLESVLNGIDRARQLGFERIKLNAVVLKNYNFDEVQDLVRFALDKGIDISFIEEMPLGNVSSHARKLEFVSSQALRDHLQTQLTLTATEEYSAGPSRYFSVAGYPSRIGFISPHSENFCGDCNRVRVSATGRLLLCLGNEHSVDLKKPLREHADDDGPLLQAIVDAMAIKPERHHFSLEEEPQILRFMNATGG